MVESLTMIEIPALIARMSRLEHFRILPHTDIQAIVGTGKIRNLEAGTLIFREDEPCSGLFVLLAGQVHLHKLSPEGRDHIMIIVEPVTMFNEVAVLDGGSNPATAIAHRECRVWHADADDFKTLLETYPGLALGMLTVLASRNRWLVSQYEDLSFRTVRSRMAKLLLELSEDGQHPISRREHTIEKIAARIATVPEAVSRSITDFRKQGAITSSRSEIEVIDPEALAVCTRVGPKLV